MAEQQALKKAATDKQDIREQLEAKYGVVGEDFVYCVVAGVPYAFRRPTLQEWEFFQLQLQNGKKSGAAVIRQVVIDTRLEPSLEQLNETLDRYPALPPKIVEQFPPMVGDDIVIVGKGA